MNRKGLAVFILVAWVAGLGLLVRREFFREASAIIAEAAMRISPSATYFIVEQDGRQIGFASTSIDTTVTSIEVLDYFVADLPVAGQTFRAKRKGDGLEGSTTTDNRTIAFTGARPPKWPAANADGKHAYGKPVELFDGKTLDTWNLQIANRPSGWSIVDGAMTNEKGANNLVSKQTFKDFKIQAEYKIEPGSNSGIYLRGRYELQVLDDFGKPAEEHGHMAIYAWVKPLVNASKSGGEWQAMEATIVGNRVTVTLNGQKVHDNAQIQAITGGALDANETEPGPIMLQGDHGKVWYRKVVVTPIARSQS